MKFAGKNKLKDNKKMQRNMATEWDKRLGKRKLKRIVKQAFQAEQKERILCTLMHLFMYMCVCVCGARELEWAKEPQRLRPDKGE